MSSPGSWISVSLEIHFQAFSNFFIVLTDPSTVSHADVLEYQCSNTCGMILESYCSLFIIPLSYNWSPIRIHYFNLARINVQIFFKNIWKSRLISIQKKIGGERFV